MTGATDSPFHVDLRGVVDLLSHHLHSGPRVHLRGLLQHSLDDELLFAPLLDVARTLPALIDRAVDGGPV